MVSSIEVWLQNTFRTRVFIFLKHATCSVHFGILYLIISIISNKKYKLNNVVTRYKFKITINRIKVYAFGEKV
jgi:hypothetical protein